MTFHHVLINETSNQKIEWYLDPEVTLFNLRHSLKQILLALIGINFIIGFVYRGVLFRNIFKNGGLKRPINFIICKFISYIYDVPSLTQYAQLHISVMEEGGKMVGSCAWLLIVGATMLLSKPVYLYTGAAFCQAANIANVFGISFGYAYGGVAIALIRTILIKNPLNMASKVGAKRVRWEWLTWSAS